jgi:hypothetical protein
VEDGLDRLFGVSLEEFTAARNALARELKKAGHAEEAARVLAVSKPSVPVWVINQLARAERVSVGELLDAGDALRRAHERALGEGAAPDAVRDATRKQRDALHQLAEDARHVLKDAGRPATAATLERVVSTLQAASVDEEGRRLLASGRLTEELEPAGFEAVGGLTIDLPARARPSGRDELSERRRRRDERREQRQELRQKVQALGKAARDAEREADRAEAAAADARRRAEQLRAEANEAERELRSL